MWTARILVAHYGLPIVSVYGVALSLRQPDVCYMPSPFVAFSCDDGTKLDWVDYQHPLFGWQRSFETLCEINVAGILFQAEHLSRHSLLRALKRGT